MISPKDRSVRLSQNTIQKPSGELPPEIEQVGTTLIADTQDILESYIGDQDPLAPLAPNNARPLVVANLKSISGRKPLAASR